LRDVLVIYTRKVTFKTGKGKELLKHSNLSLSENTCSIKVFFFKKDFETVYKCNDVEATQTHVTKTK